ncbi:hypothetical protein ACRZ5S_07350 [Vibrio scophthalmi]|uniref:hypothetical protein n=1 Tax=Vibrio scophthalmi TaxID=45658 RepID=UPI003EBDB106
MNKISLLRNIVAVTLFALLAGCSNPQIDNAQNKRVLVVAGDGLNSSYDNPNANAFFHEVSKTFATKLGSKLEEFGLESYLFVSNNADTYKEQYQKVINSVLSEGMIDGIVQVRVLHTKDATTNEIALYSTYFPTEAWLENCNVKNMQTCRKTTRLAKAGEMKYSITDEKTGEFNQTPIDETVTNMALFVYRAEQ